GRYDPEYELEGRDYPIGYVRWTERRNLECFLDLLARRRIDVEPLISHVADFSAAVGTYKQLKDGELKAVAVLFRYSNGSAPAAAAAEPAVVSVPVPPSARPAVSRPARPAVSRPARPAKSTLRVAFVGAGNYASSMLLLHLTGRSDVELGQVVTTSALSAANAKRK